MSSLSDQLKRAGGAGKSVSRIKEKLEEKRIEAQALEESEEILTKDEKPKLNNPTIGNAPKRKRKITKETFADERLIKLSVPIPETVNKAVALYCAAAGKKKQDLCFDLLVKFLTKEGYLT